jgi:hypothetical protein
VTITEEHRDRIADLEWLWTNELHEVAGLGDLDTLRDMADWTVAKNLEAELLLAARRLIGTWDSERLRHAVTLLSDLADAAEAEQVNRS